MWVFLSNLRNYRKNSNNSQVEPKGLYNHNAVEKESERSHELCGGHPPG
jgi:hypothetical protein